MTEDEAKVPRSVLAAAAIVAVEGAAIVALVLAYAGLLLVGHPHNRALALFGALIGLLIGLALLLAARGLRRQQRAAFAPIILVQIIAIPVGIGLIQGHRVPIAVAVLVPSAVVLALLLLTPGGRAVLTQE